MANIIQNSVTMQTTGGPNVYFIFVTNDSKFWNRISNHFEAFDVSHWTNYTFGMTEIGTNLWQGTFPTVIAGVYDIYAYQYVTSPDPNDSMVGFGVTNWNGVTEISNITDNTVVELDIRIKDAISTITVGSDSNNGGEIQIGIE